VSDGAPLPDAPASSGTTPDSEEQAPAPVDEVVEQATPKPRWSTRDRTRERELIALLATLPEGDPRRSSARDELVTMHLPLAGFLARRFRDRGESLDDLTQVATIGLIKAVDRFDAQRGVEFSTFATPTIVGEIKRHFRDKGWAIRVPRRLQELRISIGRATAELNQSTGRSPTVAELAAHLDVSDEEILEGLESAQAYATLSLDASSTDGSDALADTLGEDDPGLGEVDARETLHPLVATLAPREQRIIHMRFYENMTQAQIAEQIGVSQMHVSRLLAKSLAQLRSGLVEPTM
jgi:RNA polymerase sigma-B factor